MGKCIVKACPEVLTELFKPDDTRWQTVEGLPEDAKFVGGRLEPLTMMFVFEFDSPSTTGIKDILVVLKSHGAYD